MVYHLLTLVVQLHGKLFLFALQKIVNFSAENHLDFGEGPSYLSELTPVEEMLITRDHVYVNVMQVRGQRYRNWDAR